jgi:2Fe-2S ferredoxin
MRCGYQINNLFGSYKVNCYWLNSTSNNANMPRIVIANWAEKTLEVTDLSKTLLRHFQDHGLDWMHACGGKGRCTTCKAQILQGHENLEPLTLAEQKYRQPGALKEHERLCCQARIKGDIILAIPEECKLPHINYDQE